MELMPSTRVAGGRLRRAPDRALLAGLAASHRRGLEHAQFTVISNDCWGGSLYQHLRRPYTTPFVGLFLMGPCFTRLVVDLPGHLGAALRFTSRSRYPHLVDAGRGYPLAVIEDSEVHFLHYGSERQASGSWRRRVERVRWDALRVKADVGKDGMTTTLVADIRAREPGALILGPPGSVGAVQVRPYTTDGAALFRLSLRSVDLVSWLSAGIIERPSGALGAVDRRVPGWWRR